jgi:hypothetical protein
LQRQGVCTYILHPPKQVVGCLTVLHEVTGVKFRGFLRLVIVWMMVPSTVAWAQLTQAPADSLRGILRDSLTPLGSPQAVSAMVALSSLEVATVPLGTSTGGFTFEYDPLLKTYRRATQSFGPAFAQRALMTGRGKFSIGANWLHADYDSLGGYDLKDGSFQPAKNIKASQFPFSITSATEARIRMASDTVVSFVQVGITDRLDVGAVIPWVEVSLSLDGAYLGVNGDPLPPSFAPVVSAPKTSAAGVGDAGLYAKYKLVKGIDGGLAGSVEVRLPTGDKNDLRGLGITRTLVSAIWSKGGRVSPHANIGYEFWSEDVPLIVDGSVAARDQLKYAVGAEFNASPRFTALVDLVGSSVREGGKIGYQSFTVAGGTADILVALPQGINTVTVAPGIKWNAWRNLLFTGSVLASLSDDGLRARWIPVVGVDFSF